MDLTIIIKFKNGKLEEVERFTSIISLENKIEISDNSHGYRYLVNEIEFIKIKEMNK